LESGFKVRGRCGGEVGSFPKVEFRQTLLAQIPMDAAARVSNNEITFWPGQVLAVPTVHNHRSGDTP
jgi:hypothetical protein